jgi:hypothetical protein
MQVPHSLSLGAVKFLPGIGAFSKQIGGRKVVLFSEERVPHCKSLSRMAWLQHAVCEPSLYNIHGCKHAVLI